MKYFSILHIIILLFFFACDNIAEDERSSVVENVNAIRTVLLEDLTGQNCINCPKAAELAYQMQKVFNNNLVIVSIHAGTFALNTFKTEAGTAYQEKFYPGLDKPYPAGMIDRAGFDGSSITVSSIISNWKTYIFNRTQNSNIPMLNMDISCQYNSVSNDFIIKAFINGLNINSPLKLQLWITESHIIAPQKSGNETIKDYEHNHVLRDAINGIWGEKLNLESGLQEYTSPSYSLEGKNWIKENMNIVGFVYDENTYEILCVKEIPMLNH